MSLTPEAALSEALDAARASVPFDTVMLAVSGGGDSMALMHLTHAWAARNGVTLHAMTVDHGLRPASMQEAVDVGAACEALDIPHDVLCLEDLEPGGNLQARARAARYRLIAAHKRALFGGDPVPLLVGHTRDDMAETLLLRLMRGSGVDGLSAMEADREEGGVRLIRPLLSVTRVSLRNWLKSRDIAWVDDPSNDDPRFDRVRVRQVIEALDLAQDRLVQTARAMSSAREVLRLAARDAALKLVRIEAGDVLIEAEGYAALPVETRLRLMSHALRWVSSSPYRPRHSALIQCLESLSRDGKTTLSGCVLTQSQTTIRIARELNSVAQSTSIGGSLWDNRWQVHAPEGAKADGLTIGKLGENGIREVPDWRATGLPRDTLLASPAVWKGEELIAAPLADSACDWRAEIAHPWGDFFSSILSH